MNFFHRLVKNKRPDVDLKTESLNKNLLISSKCDLTFCKDLINKMGVICLTTPNEYREKGIVKHSLLFYDALRIIEAIIYDRRESTTPEDFSQIMRWLNNNLTFAIFRVLLRSNCLSVIFKISIIFNVIYQTMVAKDRLKDYQKTFLNHSTLLLRYVSPDQKHGAAHDSCVEAAKTD
jgi:hypothetical protein